MDIQYSKVGPNDKQSHLMRLNYPELHQALVELPMGEYVVMQHLDKKTCAAIRAEVSYWFQGTLEANDVRLSVDTPHIHDEWDWRIRDEKRQDEFNPSLYTLWLQKVPTPPEQLTRKQRAALD